MPPGRPETIDAKIINEIPLPMPRCVISSPIHITTTQPAVSVSTIKKSVPALKLVITGRPAEAS